MIIDRELTRWRNSIAQVHCSLRQRSREIYRYFSLLLCWPFSLVAIWSQTITDRRFANRNWSQKALFPCDCWGGSGGGSQNVCNGNDFQHISKRGKYHNYNLWAIGILPGFNKFVWNLVSVWPHAVDRSGSRGSAITIPRSQTTFMVVKGDRRTVCVLQSAIICNRVIWSETWHSTWNVKHGGHAESLISILLRQHILGEGIKR